MREFLKSFSSLSLALALLPIKQIENVLTPDEPGENCGRAVKTMDTITSTVLDQFGGTLRATFSALDNLQRGVIATGMTAIWPFRGRGGREGDRHDNSPRKSWHAYSGKSGESCEQTESATAEMHSESSWRHRPQPVTLLESMRARGRQL
jgi:hypothetical protein